MNYQMEEEIAEKYRKRLDAWRLLTKAEELEQVTRLGYVADARKNAGTKKSVKTEPVKMLQKAPFYLKPNIDVLQIHLKNGQLVLLPERILVLQGKKARVLSVMATFP